MFPLILFLNDASANRCCTDLFRNKIWGPLSNVTFTFLYKPSFPFIVNSLRCVSVVSLLFFSPFALTVSNFCNVIYFCKYYYHWGSKRGASDTYHLGVKILSFPCSFRQKVCKIIPLWEYHPQENLDYYYFDACEDAFESVE